MPYSIDHLEYALWLEGVVSSLSIKTSRE